MDPESDEELMRGDWLHSGAYADIANRHDIPTLHLDRDGPPDNPIPSGSTQSTEGPGSEKVIEYINVSSNSSCTYTSKNTDATYVQCKASRTAGLRCHATDTSLGHTAGKTTVLVKDRVGSLDLAGDTDFGSTFRGSRVSSNGNLVNQNISVSFDPATLKCTSCASQHSILPTNGSGLVVMVSDQNFVSCLSGHDSCVPIIRVEDASLLELTDMLFEILDRYPIPPGTLFLVNSISHLSKVGTTRFAYDWIEACNRLTQRWRQARVGPLTPLLREDCNSSVGRQIIEIGTWFSTIYSDSPVYAKGAWKKVFKCLSCPEEQGLDLGHREVYSVALPVGLNDTTMTTHTFFCSSSHMVTPAWDQVATNELLRDLLDTLTIDFGSKANSGDILCREPAEPQIPMDIESTPQKVIVIGASHSVRLADLLKMRNCNVTNLSVPGWVASETNIGKIETELSTIGKECCNSSTAVIDLFSNSAYRYITEDGSLAPPMKLDGVYHMGGKVTTCTPDTIGSIINRSKNLLSHLGGKKVFLPPLPRYLYVSCCGRSGHCDGVGDRESVQELLEQTLGLRKVIATSLVKAGVTDFVVLDTLHLMYGDTVQKVDEGLQRDSSSDGVHLTHNGYGTLADTVKNAIKPVSASLSVPGTVRQSYFWRGFVSPVGTPRPKAFAQTYKQNRSSSGSIRKRGQDYRRGGPYGGGGRGRGSGFGKRF